VLQWRRHGRLLCWNAERLRLLLLTEPSSGRVVPTHFFGVGVGVGWPGEIGKRQLELLGQLMWKSRVNDFAILFNSHTQ
jgi:hypothetical protein